MSCLVRLRQLIYPVMASWEGGGYVRPGDGGEVGCQETYGASGADDDAILQVKHDPIGLHGFRAYMCSRLGTVDSDCFCCENHHGSKFRISHMSPPDNIGVLPGQDDTISRPWLPDV